MPSLTVEKSQRPEQKSELKNAESLASLVKRLGSPESSTMLYSPHHVFQIPQVDGAIGYHQVGKCVVAIGDPICLPKDIPELTNAFHLFCQESRLKTVYLLTHHDFAHWGIEKGFRTLIEVGAELSLNPVEFSATHNVKRKVNFAAKSGVQVKEYTDCDPSLEQAIKDATLTWLRQRRGPQIHLGKLDFDHDAKNRIFYAQQNDKIVGVLTLTPIDRYQGWAESYNLAISDAPVGTTEHLMCSTIKALANENCEFLCLGAIASPELGEIIGLSSFTEPFARLVFKTANWVFKLGAKAVYLNKYRPTLRPVFLLARDRLTIPQLLAIKKVLNIKI